MKHMGRSKIEHIELLLTEPEIKSSFIQTFNRKPTKEDIQDIYKSFKEQLILSVTKTKEIPSVKDAVFRLKKEGIPLIMTTGYDRRMVDEIRKKLPWIDEVLLTSVTSSDVKKGRPHEFMIFHAMKFASIKNPSYVIKVGDTKVDLEAADNAHIPGIWVLSGSVKTVEDIEKFNQELMRKHLILPSLIEVIDYILDGTIVEKIKELNI